MSADGNRKVDKDIEASHWVNNNSPSVSGEDLLPDWTVLVMRSYYLPPENENIQPHLMNKSYSSECILMYLNLKTNVLWLLKLSSGIYTLLQCKTDLPFTKRWIWSKITDSLISSLLLSYPPPQFVLFCFVCFVIMGFNWLPYKTMLT